MFWDREIGYNGLKTSNVNHIRRIDNIDKIYIYSNLIFIQIYINVLVIASTKSSTATAAVWWHSYIFFPLIRH